MSLKISPNHGLNPTMGVCFFCGQDTGEIGILGKLPNDIEAPTKAILNYEPCDKCRKEFEKGIALFGVTNTCNDERPEIAPGHYPTGSVVVVTPDAIKNMDFIDPEIKEQILQAGHTLMNEDMLQSLLPEE